MFLAIWQSQYKFLMNEFLMKRKCVVMDLSLAVMEDSFLEYSQSTIKIIIYLN